MADLKSLLNKAKAEQNSVPDNGVANKPAVQANSAEVEKPTAPAKPNPFASLSKTISSKKNTANVSNSTDGIAPKPPMPSVGKVEEAEAPPIVLPPGTTVAGVEASSTAKPSAAIAIPDALSDCIDDVESVRDSIDILISSMDQPDMVKAAIINVMQQLKGNPALQEILQPEDLGLMVRGLRTCYGVTIAKKGERKTKKVATNQRVEEVVAQLGDFQI